MLKIVILISYCLISVVWTKVYESDVFFNDHHTKSKKCPLGLESSVPGDLQCYIFSEFPQQFYQAQEYCRQLSSHLVYVPNNDINQFISETSETKFDPNGELTFWLGGQNLANSNHWIWLDGTDFSKFTNWDINQPVNSTEERCLSGKIENGKWLSEKCYNTKPFVCAYKQYPIPTLQPPPSPTPTPAKSCPNKSWTYLPEIKSCFLIKNATNFVGDELFCDKFGGHLASVHSFIENSFISDLTSRKGKTVLIGFYRKIMNDVTSWEWTDSTPVDYLYWDGVVPTGDDPRNCVVLNLHSRYGHWDPVNCDDKNLGLSVCKVYLG